MEITGKSVLIAYILYLLSGFGWLGFHKFYLGKIGIGILYIFTGAFFGIGSFIDLFTLGTQVRRFNIEKIVLEKGDN